MWERTFGGAHSPRSPSIGAWDWLETIIPAADEGFLLVGQSNESAGGTKTAVNQGDWDMYVLKINALGDQVWDRAFGSSAGDGANGACATADGGCALVGFTVRSGDWDVWVVKLDSAGAQEWEHSYGGTNVDEGIAIVQRPDGGYVVAANSASEPSRDKTSPYYGGGGGFSDSSGDFWVLWLDSQGVKTNEQSFGGIYDEAVAALAMTPDGGLLLAGSTYSPASGNKTSPALGWPDGWLVRLDASGNKLWDRSFGGYSWDNLYSLRVLNDGGCLLGGQTNNTAWVARCNADGAILWEQTNGLALMWSVGSVDQAANGTFYLGGSSWPVGWATAEQT
jgi:hypothetical protein